MKRKLIPHYPATPKIKNTAFYHASPPEFLLLLERLAGINYSITFNWSIKDQVEGTTYIQVDPYTCSCCRKPAEKAAKHNCSQLCSQLRNTIARVGLRFARLSTPEQVRAACSASLEDFTLLQHTRELLHSLLEPQGRISLAVDQHQQGQIPPCGAPCVSVWHTESLRTCALPGNASSPLLKHSGLGSWMPEASWSTPPRSSVGTFP